MLKGYRIVDADSHVWEPMDMWGKYLEPAFRGLALSPELTIAGEKICLKLSDRLGSEWSRETAANYPEASLIEPSEPCIAETIQYVSTDNLLFGSDYPHADHKPDIIEEAVALEERL